MVVNKMYVAGAAALALSLGGCASAQGDFPSLSKRPYETDNPLEDTPAPAAPLTGVLPGELKAQTDAFVARARKAHDAFEVTLPAARAAAQAANGVASGSERWVNAHMVVSRSDGARADAVAALSDIDQLIALERNKGADSGLIGLLATPQGQIAEIVNSETAEIERLAGMIGV